MASESLVRIRALSKTFTLHLQGGTRLPVLERVDLDVAPGECVALVGPSGVGKSTLLRCLYGNYRASTGSIEVRRDDGWVDVAQAEPRTVLALRRRTIGHVSQFLRAIPRVPALRLVSEPLAAFGVADGEAEVRARALLARLNVREALWTLPPATFSGGEQQRVNIARGLIADFPILLLDEPTASLDTANRDTVIELIGEARGRGAAIVGIFHDPAVRARVATREFPMSLERIAA